MDKIQEYLENNFKLAYKSVTFHFKRFVWFYIALFVVQALLGIVSISSHINSVNTRVNIEEKYNSHYVFYYMNANQRYYLEKSAIYYFKDEHFFDIKEIKEYGDIKDYDYKCDVYIAFADEPQKSIERFERKYMPGLEKYGDVFCAPTPLFDLEKNIQENNALYNFYLIIVAVFSFVLLSILYNIRSNNYRFDYGIYMSFGADKKKLFNTSFWEMNVISLLTFIPAMATSVIFNYIISLCWDISFAINLIDCLKVIILTVAINSLAVLLVITKTALKAPISLIVSKDNSNFVYSPRVSVDLFAKKPLKKLARLSMQRYAKYYTVLIISSVLFASLFVCGVFCIGLYSEKTYSDRPQFEVTFTGKNDYTEKDREYFLEFDGIKGTYKELSTPVMGVYGHILVPKSNTKITANRLEYDDEYYAMDNVDYCAADKEVVEYLKTQKYSGDLTSILTQENTVIISDSFNNATHFNFKPGDKIKLADFYTRTEEPDFMLQGKDLLRERLRCYVFLYEEVTVGGVIHDNGSKNLKLYMNNEMYEEKTDRYVNYKQVYLFADESMTPSETEKLYASILKINQLQFRQSDNSVDVFVKNLYTDVYKENAKYTRFGLKLFAVSALILSVSSIIWFFSQMLFYGKRSTEFTFLRAVGLTQKDVKKMFLHDSAVLSFLGLICYTVLSFLFCFGVYRLMNSFLFVYEFRYSFDISVIALITGAVATVVSAFLSTYITYFSYKSKNRTAVPEV